MQDATSERFWTSVELRITAALCVAGVTAAVLTLSAVHRRTEIRYDDLREFNVEIDHRASPSSKEVMDLPGPQRPFRLAVALYPEQQPGDVVSATRRFAADPREAYCFEVFVASSGLSFDPARTSGFPAAVLSINGNESAVAALSDPPGAVRLRATGIRARGGAIDVRIDVRGLGAASRGPETPRVEFELARLAPCGAV